MNKVLTIAAREYKAAVLTKAFIIGMALMPIMMGGSILIQYVFKDVKNLKDKTFLVIDRTPGQQVYPALSLAIQARNEKIFDEETNKQKEPKFVLEKEAPQPDVLRQRYELAERVRRGEVFGYLDIGSRVFEAPKAGDKVVMAAYAAEMAANYSDNRAERNKKAAAKLPEEMTVRYYSNSPTYNDFHVWTGEVTKVIVQAQRAVDQKIDPTKLVSIMLPVPLTNRELPRVNRYTGEIEDGKDVNFLISFFVPFGIVILMFMVIMVGATPLMQGVVEEKMQRIAEVLLASVKPFQLMLGKLIGGVCVSLTLGTVYLAGTMYLAYQYGFSDYLPPAVIVWFVVYLILAVFMFGSLFVAVGAACSDIKETQTLLMPVMLLAMIPLFFLQKIIQEPDGALATGISFFPFATPSIMVARVAIPPGAPWWEPFAGVGVVLLTTLLCVWVAGRIFRVGLLMQGKAASFAEIAKWVWRG
jgi:ABC-2 type transport system permease protein